MRHIQASKTQKGFTLIEVMIAMGIFIVLITVGIGAVLDATSQHARTENIRGVMDNLNFVMDDMARNLRLGTEIHCITANTSGTAYFATPGDQSSDIVPADCPYTQNPSDEGTQIVFKDLNGSNTLYAISPQGFTNEIVKQTGDLASAASAQNITPSNVTIDTTKSGFMVLGSAALDSKQPTIVIRLSGTISYQNTTSTFSLETTVEERQLDS